MTSRIGAFVVLGFAAVWLWVGTKELAMPLGAAVLVVGAIALLAAVWHVLRQPTLVGRPRRFVRRRFWITVALEVVGANLVGWVLGRAGLIGYLWPGIGIVVALHFIGLWWATGDGRYLALTAGMLAVNVIALFFAPGSAAMLAVCGLGSATALTAAMVRR